jgi:glucose-1-phosphate adenylyltransferase
MQGMKHMTSTNGLPRTQAFILAGGQGERLYPLTMNRPKPAIPFGGMFRIIDFTLSNCLRSKLKNVALLTQYRHEELHSYIRDSWSGLWNPTGRGAEPLVCLAPSSGKRYRGTADAVFQNLEWLGSDRPEYVVILSGDHVYQMDYRELLAQHVDRDADATIATIEYPLRDASHFGVIDVDANFRVTGFEEKPSNPRPLPSHPERALISMGIYAFKTDVLIESLIKNCEQGFGYDFGHNVIPALIRSARVYAYDFRDEVHDGPRYWRDIGTLDSYYQANMDLVRPGSPFRPYTNDGESPATAAGTDGVWPENARVHSDCHVVHSVLSPGVRIEKGATVIDSVLMPGVHVGPGATIRKAIVEEGVEISANCRIGLNVEEDLRNYIISPAGVVVVSELFERRATVTRFEPAGGRNAMRVVA